METDWPWGQGLEWKQIGSRDGDKPGTGTGTQRKAQGRLWGDPAEPLSRQDPSSHHCDCTHGTAAMHGCVLTCPCVSPLPCPFALDSLPTSSIAAVPGRDQVSPPQCSQSLLPAQGCPAAHQSLSRSTQPEQLAPGTPQDCHLRLGVAAAPPCPPCLVGMGTAVGIRTSQQWG